MSAKQADYLAKSCEGLLKPGCGRLVIIHNEFSNDTIIRVIFSISGISVRDQVCIAAHDIEAKGWTFGDNVLSGTLIGVTSAENIVQLIVETTVVGIRFVESSSLQVSSFSLSRESS